MHWPAYDYRAASARNQAVFRLVPEATQIDVVVRRAGPLARFGHDHVVSVREAEGFMMTGASDHDARADLRFPLAGLAIDTPEARARHELDTTPSESDILGTRENLLTRVLDAGRWPLVSIELTDVVRQGDQYAGMLALTINGSVYRGRQPFRWHRDGGRVVGEGFFVLSQQDLGIEPFSILGGGLRVADPLEVHFHVEGMSLQGMQ